ncbi:uncharacterized exonuclease domain-containing protein At3g15140 isoform X1 [Coffea arabica]|uniref:Uncharacterized exonuclease domain-containing protein At3g15140 isoform X1 n=2 Tax=Coffea arabica TaxID=13443 RepID=A0ABM4UD92_COFAR
MTFPRFSSLVRRAPLPSPVLPPLSTLPSLHPKRSISLGASAFMEKEESTSSPIQASAPLKINRWKPLCLYYTQGKCTKTDDPVHLGKFNHNLSSGLGLEACQLEKLKSQEFDYFLVLDLEGKVEILEFPVLLLDAKTMNSIDFFHRFVRPSQMGEQRINQYIGGKYGKLGVDRVWHDTAIPFDEVIQQFEEWLGKHHLWVKKPGGRLNRAAFITCGNWDLKTKIPAQCKVSRMALPSYFTEWINLKDIFLNFYNRRAPGMVSMMRELRIPLRGSHHLGMDDTKNIARVVQHMLIDGALLQITARRLRGSKVEFLFENRV